ncbi:Transcription regulator IclR, C-terminal [Moorella glycerini]|uniref:Glycerol operon regulatory protein n=1 Tax=Neomoorella stamsii TaxID=1266720 RepID=A0A9X7J000_9FIRM|nr:MULTISPECIES: IclR family transcriptional regulator [Moorella]PRR68869.1 Pectin degradation repressor protein KdgR [Moorella stamsii]CEP67490.1 Transcription regulator IclR, C-terminal [Moorella glycerini]
MLEKLEKEVKYPVQTVERALEIIKLLAQSGPEGLGISELSRQLGLGKSTVHRLLNTLVAYRYVEQDAKTTKYRLGWALFEIGNVVPRQHKVGNFDIGILEDLCAEYDETVNLGIRDGNRTIVITKVEPELRLRANVNIGECEPLHATALGKILISELDSNQLKSILGEKLEGFTPHTIRTLDELINELKKVREQGYALDCEEYCYGLTCIAMPVRDFTGEIRAAVSVSGLTSRLNFNRIMEIKNGLEVATRRLSSYLGYKGGSFSVNL